MVIFSTRLFSRPLFLQSFLLRHRLFGGALLLFVMLSACDQAPTPSSLTTTPPVVSDLTYSPVGANLASLPSSQISGENVSIPLKISARLVDADGRGIQHVVYSVFAPQVTTKAYLTGEMTAGQNGLYESSPTLVVKKGDIGRYTIKVTALDKDNNISNQVLGYFDFSATGQPPVLVSVDAPDILKRPTGSDRVTSKIVATATDPDGLTNLQRVVMRTASGQEFLLLDDGQKTGTSGDDTADDGKYTITIQVTSANALGKNTFTFQAFDRSGLSSNAITKTIEIQ